MSIRGHTPDRPTVAIGVASIERQQFMYWEVGALARRLQDQGMACIVFDQRGYDQSGIATYGAIEDDKIHVQELQGERLVPNAWRLFGTKPIKGALPWALPEAGYNTVSFQEDTFTWEGMQRLFKHGRVDTIAPPILEVASNTATTELPDAERLLVRPRVVHGQDKKREPAARLLSRQQVHAELEEGLLDGMFVQEQIPLAPLLKLTRLGGVANTRTHDRTFMRRINSASLHSIQLTHPLWHADTEPIRAALRWRANNLDENGYAASKENTIILDSAALFNNIPELHVLHCGLRNNLQKTYGQLNFATFSYLITADMSARAHRVTGTYASPNVDPALIDVEAQKLTELATANYHAA